MEKDSLKVFNNKDEYFSRAYVAWEETKNKLGVAFRGTVPSSGKNWGVNIDTTKTKLTDDSKACSSDPIVLNAKPLTSKESM